MITMYWILGISFLIPILMLGLMVYLLIMQRMKKTNRFIKWLDKQLLKKTSNNELIFYNFWLFGVILFLMGVGCWLILWTTPEIHLFSVSGFILISMSLVAILGGEMRIFLFYDKYFVQKNFDGPDPAVEAYSKYIDMKMKLKSYTSELYNSHRPPWYKDEQLWMMSIGVVLMFLIILSFL